MSTRRSTGQRITTHAANSVVMRYIANLTDEPAASALTANDTTATDTNAR